MQELKINLRYYGTFQHRQGVIEVLPHERDPEKVRVEQTPEDGETEREVITRDKLVKIIERARRHPGLPYPARAVRLSREVFSGELGGQVG